MRFEKTYTIKNFYIDTATPKSASIARTEYSSTQVVPLHLLSFQKHAGEVPKASFTTAMVTFP